VKYALLIAAAWCSAYSFLSAQNNEFYFTKFDVEDGLASMETYSTLQDKQGYLWVGTDAGLTRFDGYNFLNYTRKDGLSNNDVVDLFQDSKDRIWIHSLGPLVYMEKGTIHPFEPLGFEWDPYWFSLIEVKPGQYLMSCAKELYLINEDLEVSLYKEPPFDQKRNYRKLFKNEDGSFWAFLNRGFYKIKDGAIIDSISITKEELPSDYFYLKEFQGRLYYTAHKGLLCYDLQTEEFSPVQPDLTQIRFLNAFDDRIWVVDSEGGVQVIEYKDGQHSAKKIPLPENVVISSMAQDREGNFWLATFGHGLFFLPANYEHVEVLDTDDGIENVSLPSIAYQDGKIWAGSGKSVLYCIEGNEVRSLKLSPSLSKQVNRIIDIEPLSDGALLLATDLGAALFENGQFYQINKDPTKSITVIDNKNVLITTSHGVYEVTLDYLRSKPEPVYFHRSDIKAIMKRRSYAAYKDKTGRYWCDDTNSSLITIDGDTTFHWDKISPIFRSSIVKILQLDNGIIALATQGEGVLLVKDKDFIQINVEKGLSSDICNDMITDGKNLWIATIRGLSTIKEIDFERKNYQLNVFNNLDGLITNEIRGIARNGNEIYLASPAGMMRLDERKLNKISAPPYLNITEIFINEQDTVVKASYELEPDQNNIRIQFVGLSYSNLGNLVYQYKLEGIDEDWVKTTALETHYSKLPPGEYRFQVTTVGLQGMSSMSPATINFRIKPAFIQTPLFKILLGTGVLILGLILLYTLYSTLQRKQLSRMVAEQTQELNEKVGALAELNEKLERSNQELAEYAHVASHDLKSPLRNVAGFIQLLKRRGKDRLNEEDLEFINLAVKGVKHMEHVINDLLSMSKVNQLDINKESVNFGAVVQEIVNEMQLQIEAQNAEIVMEPELPTLHFSATNAKQLFQNLISNALKYQDKDKPKVEVGYIQENGHYQFFVKDNGIGIDDAYKNKVFLMFQRLHTQNDFSGTGIGLSICKKIVENNKGQIWFESEPGEGTTFFFTLPKN
jgi:signal transduction histidine kinase/ligand-binding sensor domain-containing protein